jgi:uncharacterized protein (TIGR02270 family)
MQASLRPAVASVLQQHVDDAVNLRQTRASLVRAPHVRLRHLLRLDEQLRARLDGIRVAGAQGMTLLGAALSSPDRANVFALAVSALESQDGPRLSRLIALAEGELPQARTGLVSAMGWVAASSLRGIVKSLLDAPQPFHQELGLAACAIHGVDGGTALQSAVERRSPRALDYAAASGRLDLVDACLAASGSEEPAVRFAAARAALLLGDRHHAVEMLAQLATGEDALAAPALQLTLLVSPAEHAQVLLMSHSRAGKGVRSLIRATGTAGDPHYVPWLIKQMDDLKLSRLAGEAFSLITGIDLAQLDLERKPPQGEELVPNDEAADTDVSMDEDDGLPWPDPQRVGDWWQVHGGRFAAGTRYFMGEPPSPAHCLSVLRNGFQRQRGAAAQYLRLLTPGTPMFNTSAPAWRQQRLLAAMPT